MLVNGHVGVEISVVEVRDKFLRGKALQYLNVIVNKN